MRRVVGIFGGTFDPVHCGHLRTVEHVAQRLNLDWVEFVLCARPPHRTVPAAAAHHRWAMLERALAPFPRFRPNAIEVHRPGPSYTVWTLRALRHAHPECVWCLIVGADQYLALESWHRWPEIPTHAHIVVLRRATGSPVSGSGRGLRVTDDPTSLRCYQAGWVFFCDTPWVDVSASAVRAGLAAGDDLRERVPAPVLAYISEQGLYCTDKSRTHAI